MTDLAPDSPIATSFRPASHYERAKRAKGEVRFVCVHTAECSLGVTAAEGLQNFFSMSSTGVSTQYAVDPDSVEQSVPEAAIAYAASHHGNLWGIHVEFAGWAKETPTEWDSPANVRMLDLAAQLFADVCARWDLPVEFVDAAGLLAGGCGVTTHHEVSAAWKESTHYDPGTGFPMLAFLAMVRGYLPQSVSDTDPAPTLPSPTTASVSAGEAPCAASLPPGDPDPA
jgi:hypothetical protein